MSVNDSKLVLPFKSPAEISKAVQAMIELRTNGMKFYATEEDGYITIKF